MTQNPWLRVMSRRSFQPEVGQSGRTFRTLIQGVEAWISISTGVVVARGTTADVTDATEVRPRGTEPSMCLEPARLWTVTTNNNAAVVAAWNGREPEGTTTNELPM